LQQAEKDEDKLVYGIRPVDRMGTPAGEPESYPEAEPDVDNPAGYD
jgi:hypothetical protein